MIYDQEFAKMEEKAPENFRVDYAVSREQTNEKGEKMYIQTRMAQYANELWELLKKDNTYIYMCGLKGMEKGIDDIMLDLAAKDGKMLSILRTNSRQKGGKKTQRLLNMSQFAGIDWITYKKELKKAEQWNVEVY